MKKWIPYSGAIVALVLFYLIGNKIIEKEYIPVNKKVYEKAVSLSELRNMHFEKKHNNLPKDNFKFDNPNAYFEYHWGIRTRKSEKAPGYEQDYRINALKKAKSDRTYRMKKNARVAALAFTERGPANVPGRTRAILPLSSDPENVWLAGAVGGGIWKTTDGGQHWINKTPDMPSLAISWLAGCKTQPNIIYASTGETNGAGVGIAGDGVFKSIDGGDTWSQLASTTGQRAFTFINRIIVDPNDPDKVLFCTSQGGWEDKFRSEIYRSVNGGQTWTRTHQADAWIFQIIANPLDFNTIYAAKWKKGVLKSTDGGLTWIDSSVGFNKVSGRVELAIAPTDTSRLYASVQGEISGAGADLYVSYNSGGDWSFIDQKYQDKAVDFFRGQGDYDNTILVNPFDEDEVYYGGVSLWKTNMKEGTFPTVIPVIDVSIGKGDFSIWEFMNFGADYFNGKLEKGKNLNLNDFVDVEVRTGPGLSQYAHRFTVDKKGAGVPDTGYYYQDYVEVPFEVWDVSNQRQLMVSFRDQQEDSVFNLLYQNTEAGDDENHSREYLFIHEVTYDTEADTNIAKRGDENEGYQYRQMYFYWPVLREGLTWDPDNLELDTISIDYENLAVVKRFGELQPVSDAYKDFDDNLNPAYGDGLGFGFHPDHHNLTVIPVNPGEKIFKILNSNDGGIYVSNDSTSPGLRDGDWFYAGSSYNTGQFYSAVKKPGFDEYLGGLQDNGTWRTPKGEISSAATDYEALWGGDGFDVLWHYTDTKQMMLSVYNNQFYRTDDEGKTWYRASNGLGGLKPFFSKLANSNSKPDVIYTVSSLGVYRSNNFGISWVLTSITDDWGFSSFIDVKVSLSNKDIIWAGNGMSEGMKLHVSTDGAQTFSGTTNFTGAELGGLSGLATHPSQDSTAYVLFSFAKGPKILRTENLGQTWEDISGFNGGQVSSNGFPDVAVYCLLVRPDDENIIWAGTEIGIFESTDNGQSWAFLNSDLGAAAIWDMNVMDDQVVIATHGRGIFTAALPYAPEVVVVPEISAAGTMIKGDLGVEVLFNSPYDTSFIYINGIEAGRFESTPKGKGLISITGLPVGDSLGISFTSFRKGKAYHADPVATKLFNVNAPVSSYFEDFNTGSDDFVGEGYFVTKFSGFDDFAIHSRHSYPEGTGNSGDTIALLYQLRTPIIVAEQNAILEYKDIAIIETGEAGTGFPDEKFYDYVVIEGSDDGLNWRPLAPGYDANKNSKWKSAYTGNKKGDKSMYLDQQIDLHDTFQVNDTIFVRFKLYSDPLTAAWGWSVDDLSIQNVVTGLEEDDFELLVYPNPIENLANIKYNLSEESHVRLTVLSLQGLLVESIDLGNQAKGKQHYLLNNLKVSPGIYVLRMNIGSQSYTRKIVVR